MRDEADRRCHGTVQEIVAERFAREGPTLRPVAAARYDTAYRDVRQVSWDAYIEVRGRRYSVPANWAGQTVQIRLTLEDELTVYHGEQVVASHRVVSGASGWVTVPSHHATLWAQTLTVEQRPLAVYEEVAS